MKKLVCKICGKPRNKGRRLCTQCNSKRVASSGRYMWTKICEACGNEYKAWRKLQDICSQCYEDSRTVVKKATNNYVFVPGTCKHLHRQIAENLIGRKLQTNEVVHHMNEDPTDNRLENLIVIDRRVHINLRRYLGVQRVIIEKSMNENPENCWNILRIPMTTAWLETAGVKVIKLWEIGQSAGEGP